MSCSNCSTPYQISRYFAYPSNCVALPIKSDDLIYSGPNLPYTGIKTCNSITVAIQKIDEKIGQIVMELYNMSTTTTSTSTSSTTTTTTTTI